MMLKKDPMAVTFEMMRKNISIFQTPAFWGTSCGATIKDEFFPFQCDKQKMYCNITKLTKAELEELPVLLDCPLAKQLVMIPYDMVCQTLANTTQNFESWDLHLMQSPKSPEIHFEKNMIS